MTYANGLLGEIWIFIGGRKRGKTTEMIKRCKNVPNERLFYNEFHGNKWNTARRLRRQYMDDDDFLDFALTVKDSVLVFEDASAIFKVSLSKKAIRMLARTRDEGVTVLLAFHSFKKVPDDIIDMIDGMMIMSTEDEERHVTQKTSNAQVLEAFRFVKNSSNFREKKIVRFIPKN